MYALYLLGVMLRLRNSQLLQMERVEKRKILYTIYISTTVFSLLECKGIMRLLFRLYVTDFVLFIFVCEHIHYSSVKLYILLNGQS